MKDDCLTIGCSSQEERLKFLRPEEEKVLLFSFSLCLQLCLSPGKVIDWHVFRYMYGGGSLVVLLLSVARVMWTSGKSCSRSGRRWPRGMQRATPGCPTTTSYSAVRTTRCVFKVQQLFAAQSHSRVSHLRLHFWLLVVLKHLKSSCVSPRGISSRRKTHIYPTLTRCRRGLRGWRRETSQVLCVSLRVLCKRNLTTSW